MNLAHYLAKILEFNSEEVMDEKKTKELINSKLQGKKKRPKFA
jgi:hypothetical protein